MTITDTTAPLTRDLRALTDAQLQEAWDEADVDDPAVFAAFLAEFDQRTAAERMGRARAVVDAARADAELDVEAQYRAASAACNGQLVARTARQRVRDDHALWRMPEDRARRLASPELLEVWDGTGHFVSPRRTAAQIVRARLAENRAARAEARTSTEGDNHEHDGDAAGAGLADPDTSPLRHEPAAPQAPQAGPGRAVQRGGPDHGTTGDAGGEAAGGRPGRTVQPGLAARKGREGMEPETGLKLAGTFAEADPGDQDTGDTPENGTRAKTFAETEEIDQEWLWPGMIPAGLLAVVFGPPKASKTTLVIDYAARVSRGDVNPDGTSLGPAAPVLLGALEDISESSTIKKLKAAKADLSMVVDISRGPDGDGLELELDHVAWLHEVAAEHPGTALIIIDTLSNSANKPITTRPGLKAMLKPLAALAANTGAAVILTAHSIKGHDDIPEGGRSLVSIPRMVLQIGKSADEPGVRTLSVHASNVASDSGEGYRYKVIEDGAASRLEWCWDAVRTGPGPEATGQARIQLLLRNSPEPMSAQMISAKTGINYAVTRVLLTRMKKRGDVAQGEQRGTWAAPDNAVQCAARTG